MDNRGFAANLAQRLSCDVATATRLLEGFGVMLREQCGEENRVAIPGFGTFEGVKQQEEVVTDLTTGKRMLLPPSIEVRFIAGGMLRKSLKGGAR